MEAEQSVVNNPVKMSKMMHQLQAELDAKAEKKRAKKEAKKAKKDAKKVRWCDRLVFVRGVSGRLYRSLAWLSAVVCRSRRRSKKISLPAARCFEAEAEAPFWCVLK